MAISPSAGILPLPIPLTRTALKWSRSSRISPATRTAIAASGPAVRWTLFKNLKMADNAIGYTHASGNFGRSAFTSRVVDSLFVGETENIGNPRTPAEMAYGRSLPEPEVADFPIRGYEFYDYHHELDNDTFVNFQDNATRKTGAISYLLYTSFGMSSNNTVQRAKFINAKPVYFPPMEYKWSNDDYGNGSYKTSVFHDKDGSVSGVPDSYILINDENDGIAIDEACEVKPTWNAAVCKGDVGRLTVGGRRRAVAVPAASPGAGPGAAGGPGGRGPARARGPGAGAGGPARGGRGSRRNVWSAAADLRSRQSFSAAMARTSPSPEKPTYERVPSSR